MKIGLVVPVLNPGETITSFINAISVQTKIFDRIVIIDSSHSDPSVKEFHKIKAIISTIDISDFDHGATRELGVKMMNEMDIFVFLTQDSILAHPEAVENLLDSFNDPSVGAAYGRQLPRKGADFIETHARLFNYPSESRVKSLKDAPTLGIKTVFLSNSFSAYRRQALFSVGGFPLITIFGEDTYVAAKMIKTGWRIAYRADAMVYHSHKYSYIEEFKRYFDIGVFHASEPWILGLFGRPTGEGKRFVFSEINYLWKSKKSLIVNAIMRTLLKFCGYKLGKCERRLPTVIKYHLSRNKTYWKRSNRA